MTPEEKIPMLEKRISELESQIAFLKHTLDMKDIIKPTTYPPYTPWTTPVPVESMFSPSQWLCIEQRHKN